jgi:hypothetical protein
MVSKYCDFCGQYIAPTRDQACYTLPEFYNCCICGGGSCDICLVCYEQGRRCNFSNHTLRRQTTGVMSIPYTEDILNILEAHARTGNRDGFKDLIGINCRSVMFFSIAHKWYGTASSAIEPGDVVTVLFGSRVPFILRKHGSGYRIVSTCYVQDLMDGEVMDMLKNGDLETEMFAIC